MKFATTAMADEYQRLPAVLRQKLEAVDAWLAKQPNGRGGVGLPDLYIVEVGRTDDESARIYGPLAERLVRELELGLPMEDRERVLAVELAKLTLEQRERWARNLFSWHRCFCAVRIRHRAYSRQTRRELLKLLRHDNKMHPGKWEIREHELGFPDHFHVAFQDQEQRKRLLGS